MQQLQKGAHLQGGKYIIERILGQGGFGITYLATHSVLEKNAVLKELLPKDFCDRDENTSHLTIGTRNSAEIVEMLKSKFIKEAKNISKLTHPNIITFSQKMELGEYTHTLTKGVSVEANIWTVK